MRSLIKLKLFLLLNLPFSALLLAAEHANTTKATLPIRTIVMPFKLIGNLDTKLDEEHKQRLAMANTALRKKLQDNKQYDLVDEAASEQFSQKVTTALSNNNCNKCESTLAKALNAKQIIVPWVYRLSNLVLTMHFVILDVDSSKTILKKSLDFRGDNDQSWQRAIQFFANNLEQPS